jgi:hypothetical protein
MHNRVVVYEADRCIGWEPGKPELASNGSRWRFDLTPDGPNATLVIATYDCTDSPEKVRDAVDNGNAWLAGMTKTLERLDQLCTTQYGIGLSWRTVPIGCSPLSRSVEGRIQYAGWIGELG